MSSTLREWVRKTIALASRITSMQPVGWREFLWLCLPALLVGLFLRGHFLWVTPQAFFGADSSSNFDFSYKLFTDGDFELSPKRRWFYPIVLALLTPLPLLSSWNLVPLVQHGLGLVTVVGIGWITLRLSAWPRLTVPLVTLICAIWPRMLWYEHEIIAESFLLAAFVLTISLALIPDLFRNRRGLLLLFLSMILLAGFKAVGRFLWLGAIIGILIYAGDPRRWAWSIKSALAAITSVIIAATVGQSSQGYWLLLNSVLPLVQESGEPHGRYRKALRPLILEARSTGDNYPWNKSKYKKMLRNRDPAVIHADWAALVKSERQFTEVARSLSSQAIREHPVKFLKFTISSIALATKRGGVLPRFEPPTFWRDQLKTAKEIEMKEAPTYLALAFRVDHRELERLASNGRRKTYGLMGFHLWTDEFFRPLAQPSGQQGLATLIIRPFGMLVGLGMLLCLRPGFIRRAALLLAPSGVYALAVFAVGDAVPRYLHPIEWVGFILGILALEMLLRLAFKLFRILRTFVLSRPRQQTIGSQ